MSNVTDISNLETELYYMRKQMIAETEAFLADALEHPETAVVIPTMPEGTGEFSKIAARHFWESILGDF